MRLSIIVAALSLAACATAKGPRIVLVETDPAGALVRVEGFGECESPCRIEVDAPRALTIGKAGYEAQRIVITPGDRTVRLTLKLAAPTTTVDQQKLPDL